MYKVLCLNKISKHGLKELPANYTVTEDVENEKSPEGIILRSFDMHSYDLAESLMAVARAGAGVNNVPIDKCSEQGIVVFNTPGANANAVKELVIAGLLLSSRKIVQGINWVQSLKDETGVAKLVEKGKSQFVGPEIMGKKLGVIGLGAIGVLIANACNDLGMDVYGYDPFTTVEAAWRLNSNIHKIDSLDGILTQCDYITIHIPLNGNTKEMFNDEAFGKMKKGACLLNFARGELVSNVAVKKAIADGQVGCYVTDFPSEDLLGIEGIITVPHLGASTPESEENCAQMAAAQLRDYLDHGNIRNSVNLPNCELEYVGKKRYCVIHKNIPAVLSGITNLFSEKKINIDNMMNKSLKDYAYTMLDIDGDVDVKDEICKINGIIKVRIIG